MRVHKLWSSRRRWEIWLLVSIIPPRNRRIFQLSTYQKLQLEELWLMENLFWIQIAIFFMKMTMKFYSSPPKPAPTPIDNYEWISRGGFVCFCNLKNNWRIAVREVCPLSRSLPRSRSLPTVREVCPISRGLPVPNVWFFMRNPLTFGNYLGSPAIQSGRSPWKVRLYILILSNFISFHRFV